jgi:F-type H+-transporting ATPase subunit epsilon
MPDSITLRVITPERIALDTTASSVVLPGKDGKLGVLPRHAPLVTALAPGELVWQSGGKRERMCVSGGFAEVRDNTLRVVTEASERPDEIDVNRAKEAEQRARERLRTRSSGSELAFDELRAEAALYRALARQFVGSKGT